MALTALVLALLALVLALKAGASASKSPALDDLRTDGRRRVENLREETEAELAKLREMVAILADGGTLSGDMVREARLWSDVLPDEAARLYAAGDVHVVDVRTPQETAAGIVPGAALIPIDQLEDRIGEVPRDGKTTLIYCAAGGRSAAACEYLSEQGYTGLLNLQGGFGAWTGPTESPN